MNLLNSHGWQMSNAQLKAALGIDSSQHWPLNGVPMTDVDGTKVYVLPPKAGTRKHRAFAICNDCARHIPAGRLHQHRAIHRPITPAGRRRIYDVDAITLAPLGTPIRMKTRICARGREVAKEIAVRCWRRAGVWVSIDPRTVAAYQCKRFRPIPESRQ